MNKQLTSIGMIPTIEERIALLGSQWYVYGIVRSSSLAYIGMGQAERVFYSLKKHAGDSFFLFAINLDHDVAKELERTLIQICLPPDNIQLCQYIRLCQREELIAKSLH